MYNLVEYSRTPRHEARSPGFDVSLFLLHTPQVQYFSEWFAQPVSRTFDLLLVPSSNLMTDENEKVLRIYMSCKIYFK